MKYYGLHFTGSDHTPLQVRVDTRTQQVFARSCPNGQWTSWRRLDVLRNADGTLAEEVEEATHAKKADSAGRWTWPMRLTFTGDVTGQVMFDGSANKSVKLSLTDEWREKIERVTARVEAIESEMNKEQENGYHDGD